MKINIIAIILFVLTLGMWVSRAYVLERYAVVYQTLVECQGK